ncbi:tetraprenyl-beta-curcumene synthase family protein [Xylanibacillus composti]|nr:tetraprenyl-beta-curcumene synthase family protein [Xylanibacillus composti]MDT9724955.1 tetraprenyl-beta-curcumene synthase family protein [Xylanibacillus composti]
MLRMYRSILPEVDRQLAYWQEEAERIPDPELRKQALASMRDKRFHCQGGAVYAAMRPEQAHVLIPLIVALQTISDYLDNLCDRSTSMAPEDFRSLHQSMLDAIDPGAALQDYYRYRSEQDDGGYLHRLVRTCQSCICMLPSYSLVMEQLREWVSLYADLQVHKHIRHDARLPALLDWFEQRKDLGTDLRWNEYAAATGSTLGMFTLFALASDKHLAEDAVNRTARAYFPYINGLHILLDYLIDQAEDEAGGDLNFCSYYTSGEETASRIQWFAEQARMQALGLAEPAYHGMVVEGLLALYLSDPKVEGQHNVRQISKRLMKRSPLVRLFFWINSVWIRYKTDRRKSR